MRVLITGAAGFIGQLLAKTLLNDEEGKYSVVLTDIIEPSVPKGVKWADKAQTIKADLLVDSASVVTKDLDAIYMFHGIMSSGSEANFDLGMKVNFDATRSLLEALRHTCPGVRVVYTSSLAVYGGGVTEPVEDSAWPTPETSYGMEKMMCEYMISEYNRRGFVNGIVLRLPTISVRPGAPTAAASSFMSGIIREPMQGKECILPLKDRSYRHWLCSPRTLIRNLIHALSLAPDAMPAYNRVVNLPGISITVQDMLDSLARVGGEGKLQYVKEEEDPKIKPILYSWPARYNSQKALGLGFIGDTSFDDAVRDFKEYLENSP